ncbi:cytochrome P450 3A7 [Aplysia californica]|uniref:Cytochrome P450 3A7 n=1 Tax=Aplysia californica TaxID=6500 RepID=A0ABM0JRN0_APLCA|nr:cytochrome P450 3A7 [Aplysia californica]XP_005099963.1 cytochrome P450 3A7 [Aplysia californica]XP_012938849.1 cytochrome P450 3A7 [Aplysia californica]XP_012938850.1 cytochrome P450 3A7 [Aplysia californica]XP_035826064.1 cytochrome P450 3A7 [Aplysia californica]
MEIVGLFLGYPVTSCLLCVLALLLAWICFVKSHYSVFQRMGLPGPEPVFLMGNTLDFAKKLPLEVFKYWTKKYGHVYGFYEGLRPSVVVSCPDLAHQILVKHFNKFSARPVINPFTHEQEDLSLQNSSGDLWKRQRQAVAGGLSSGAIRQMLPQICNMTNKMLESLGKTTEFNESGFFVDKIIECYSLDWFAHAALYYPTNAMADESDVMLRYMRASHESMSPDNAVSGLAKLFPLLTRLLKPLDKTHRQVTQLMTQHATTFVRSLQNDITQFQKNNHKNIICQLIKHQESSGTSPSQGKASPCRETDEKQNVNHAQQSSRPSLKESEVVGEISGLVGGGVGPISSALTFCLYTLAVYPQKAERVVREVDALVFAKDVPSLEELNSLQYLDAFINETLRLFPVAPGVSRMCIEDCTVNDIPFSKGTVVRVMGSTMNCDQSYFDRPSEFLPERFLQSDSDTAPSSLGLHPLQKSAWIPFGLGPRMCVGQRLAQVVLKLSLVRILQEFNIRTSHLTQVPLEVALRPFLVARDGVHVQMSRRKQNPMKSSG